MAHKVDSKVSHTKLHNHLTSGKPLNIKGYSHVVAVRKDKTQSWLDKGYEIIQDSEDAVLVGKKKKIMDIKKEAEVKIKKEAEAVKEATQEEVTES